MLKGGNAIQRGLERLETAAQKASEAQQGQLQCPGQGLGQSQGQYRMGREWIESSAADKVLGLLADKKLSMTHQHVPVALRAKRALSCTTRCDQQGEGGDSTPFC